MKNRKLAPAVTGKSPNVCAWGIVDLVVKKQWYFELFSMHGVQIDFWCQSKIPPPAFRHSVRLRDV